MLKKFSDFLNEEKLKMTKAEVIKNYKEAKVRLEREMKRYDIYHPRHEELRLQIYQINEFLDILENYLE